MEDRDKTIIAVLFILAAIAIFFMEFLLAIVLGVIAFFYYALKAASPPEKSVGMGNSLKESKKEKGGVFQGDRLIRAILIGLIIWFVGSIVFGIFLAALGLPEGTGAFVGTILGIIYVINYYRKD